MPVQRLRQVGPSLIAESGIGHRLLGEALQHVDPNGTFVER